MRAVCTAALALLLPTPSPQEIVPPQDIPAVAPEATKTIDGLLDTLYGAVSFGPGEEGDWELVRSLLVEDAIFIQPFREPQGPKVLDVEGFVLDFKNFIASSRAGTEGFNERIAARRTDVFGKIAHSYVVFESRYGTGGGGPKGRGLDSIQLVQHAGRWWIASITTEFETPDRPLPERFLKSD